MPDSYRIVETRAGFMAIVASARGLRRVYLPERSAAEQRRRVRLEAPGATEDDAALPGLAEDLRRYFRGEQVRFKVRFDWPEVAEFTRLTWEACARIPYGAVESYGALARKLHRPRAARAVGNAMRNNPCPIVVPCHRVIAGSGGIGGYSGSRGVAFKKQLLELERAGGGVR